MAIVDLIMPKMGESIIEATILKWLKNPGDTIELDETVLEIATDKVDSEIPSPVEGVLKEILFQENEVVPVGTAIARISTEGADNTPAPSPAIEEKKIAPKEEVATPAKKETVPQTAPAVSRSSAAANGNNSDFSKSSRFYSPLVKNIAKSEGITVDTLDTISGSGANGRVTKRDLIAFIQNKPQTKPIEAKAVSEPNKTHTATVKTASTASVSGGDEIIEMDRMRKLIADHMVMSKHTSPHVTSFVEADVTDLVNWRNKVKANFQEKHGEKITFTPLFVDAITKAIGDFPMINISLDGTNIIKKKNINIGMATALPSGNLIVPVIKNADRLNLVGLTKSVNELANKARTNKLKPEDIQGGTFTLTNVGTFGNVMGTPIINQPQVAILATGAIRKKPAVLETEYGDVIAVRQMMFLSLSYDHRIVDGFLGGSFLRKVADYLEAFDTETEV